MKKLLFVIAISLLLGKAKAQTEKGNFMVGGSVYFNSEKEIDKSKPHINFSIVPSIGYFISTNFAIGAGIGYNFDKYQQNYVVNGNITSYQMKTQGFVISPFARYYLDVSEKFKFFGQLSVPLSFTDTKEGDINGHNYVNWQSSHNLQIAFSPGFVFFPNKRIGIELSVNGISYEQNRIKYNPSEERISYNQFKVDANLFAPKLGIQFYF